MTSKAEEKQKSKLELYKVGALSAEEQAKYKKHIELNCRYLAINIRNAGGVFVISEEPVYFTKYSLPLKTTAEILKADNDIMGDAGIFAAHKFKSKPDDSIVYIMSKGKQNEDAKAVYEYLTRAGVKVEHIDTEKPLTAAEYLTLGLYDSDIDYLKQYQNRKMNLHPDIDRYLSLYPGLAVLGGQASLGKTTFAVNIACNLLKNGETVLYFALEQRTDEIINKILARHIYEKNPQTEITNIDLTNGNRGAEVRAALSELPAILKNLKIINSDFETKAADITKAVNDFMNDNPEIKPVVIVDYLQIIAPPKGYKGSSKTEYIDENLKALKKWQKNAGLFVLVISSFNRANNYKPVSYESFLYTSAIEYTCDYVFGLQMQLQDPETGADFYTRKGKQGGEYSQTDEEQRRLMQAAQQQTPKKIQFVSLKNRKGRQLFKANFDYYPAHDFVKPDYFHLYGKAHPYNDIFEKIKNAGD